MTDANKALEALLDALARRTNGVMGRHFENIVSPTMADAFVKGWVALGRNPLDIPGAWQEMADVFNEIG